jgi:predicted ATPase
MEQAVLSGVDIPVRVTNSWYVITGGPCSGKTTTVRLLGERGYSTAPEQARHYIERELGQGRCLDEIKADKALFQHGILELQLQQEHELQPDRTTFLDRGIPDNLAYQRHYHLALDPLLLTALEQCWYRRVFLLDLLPLATDSVRNENEAMQCEIHQFITETYTALPFPLVRVPVLPPQARVDFILSHMQ